MRSTDRNKNKPFTCGLCWERFHYWSSLEDHLVARHQRRIVMLWEWIKRDAPGGDLEKDRDEVFEMGLHADIEAGRPEDTYL